MTNHKTGYLNSDKYVKLHGSAKCRFFFLHNLMCLKFKVVNPKNDIFRYNPALQADFAEDRA
jgi:hypothetical protein